MDAQKAEKALTNTTKENKEFDTRKKQEQKNNAFSKTKAGPMAGAVEDVENSITLSGYAGARADRCQRMTKMQSSS